MRMWSPNNVERAMQTDPTLLRFQPHFQLTQQHAAFRAHEHNAHNAASVCTELNILFDRLHSSYRTQPYVTQ